MKSWTIMVYMAGDNNLERAAYDDLDEMLTIGSSAAVDVVVQCDSRFNGTARYYLAPGHPESLGTRATGTNTGDPAVLIDFIRWARQAYPARHYMLVIWGHGTGWENLPADLDWQTIRDGDPRVLHRAIFSSTVRQAYRQLNAARAIALDTTSRDFLDNNELRQALVDGLDGQPLDVLGFDACLMAMIEIGYHLRDQAAFLVGAQDAAPDCGWPYAAILRALHASPDLAPRAVSALVVQAYRQMAIGERAPAKYTQAALDLGQIARTAALIRAVADPLLAGYPAQLPLRRAVDEAGGGRGGAKRFGDGHSVDLYDWASLLRDMYTGADAVLPAALDALCAHLAPGAPGGLVVATAAEGGDDGAQIHGVSIYLPPRAQYNALYADLPFATDAHWDAVARRVSGEPGD